MRSSSPARSSNRGRLQLLRVLPALAFLLPSGCKQSEVVGPSHVEPTMTATPAPSAAPAATASAAPRVPAQDAAGLVRTVSAATHVAGREDRAAILMAGCGEIPSCAGACPDALKKASSAMTRHADRDRALAACFTDFEKERARSGLAGSDWIERHVTAYAGSVLAANVLDGKSADHLRADLSRLHQTAVVIDARGIRLDTESQPLVPLPADASSGADASYKRSGAKDLYLVPLGDALKREVAAGRVPGPLRLLADEKTPYRVLLEVLFTAGQSEVAELELLENSGTGRALALHAPRPSSAASSPPPGAGRLNLVAVIVDAGVAIKAAGGNVAPGCKEVGPGVAIPRAAGALDLAALSTCVGMLRQVAPAFQSEDSASILAQPTTKLREVMDVALAVQGPSRSLFPNIALAAP